MTKKALKKPFLELLKETPVIGQACFEIGVVPSTIDNWRNESPSFDRDVRDAIRIGMRYVEARAMKRARENDDMTKWLLSRKLPEEYGRHREDAPREESADNETQPTIIVLPGDWASGIKSDS